MELQHGEPSSPNMEDCRRCTPLVTQAGNDSLSPVRCQLSSISSLRIMIESGSL